MGQILCCTLLYRCSRVGKLRLLGSICWVWLAQLRVGNALLWQTLRYALRYGCECGRVGQLRLLGGKCWVWLAQFRVGNALLWQTLWDSLWDTLQGTLWDTLRGIGIRIGPLGYALWYALGCIGLLSLLLACVCRVRLAQLWVVEACLRHSPGVSSKTCPQSLSFAAIPCGWPS